MRKVAILALALCLSCGLVLLGCTANKTASGNEAIEVSKTMQTVQQKVDYLVGQAKAFYGSKQFQEAVNISQYVLAYLDKNSLEAKNLLEKAKSELAALAQQKAQELKSKIPGFGK